jgi:hypothetical protein
MLLSSGALEIRFGSAWLGGMEYYHRSSCSEDARIVSGRRDPHPPRTFGDE